MNIKVLGSGCPNCIRLEKYVKKALKKIKKEATIEKVTEMKDIMNYGVMSTPALVVDGNVLFSGRVPSVAALKDMLQ